MRKRLSFLFVLALSAVMAYGVIGSAAQFTSVAAPVQQNLQVGLMELQIGNPQSITCVIPVNTATGTAPCPTIQLTVTGSIIPDHLWVEASVNGAEQPELFTFAGTFPDVTFSRALNAFTYVDLGWPTSAELSSYPFTSTYSWAGLGNPSMGDNIVVTLTFTATQG